MEITGNKNFLDTAKLRSYLQIQPASRLASHGRYSEALLKSDVATLESLYRSSGFRQVKIETKVDDNYRGTANRLAVHIHIEEGVRTRVGELHILGTQKIKANDLPELSTRRDSLIRSRIWRTIGRESSIFISITDFPTPRWKSRLSLREQSAR